MKFGSLFSGIGGFDLGLEWAGMECAWQVENNDYCQRVLAQHWPKVERFEDVRECGSHNLAAVDLIAGGFPCQPHSVAGKRRGAEDDRNLWPEFIRVVRELKPRYVLAENVPGIITTYIDTVLSDLEGEGYTCATFNLPAVAFDAPHRRERIFIVAFMDDTKGGRRRLREAEDFGQNTGDVNSLGNTGALQPSDVADTDRARTPQSQGCEQEKRGRPINSGEAVADASGQGLEERNGSNSKKGTRSPTNGQSWWTVEPDVGRVAHGIPNRVHRLRGLGNAVAPQVAEWVGRRILEFDEHES